MSPIEGPEAQPPSPGVSRDGPEAWDSVPSVLCLVGQPCASPLYSLRLFFDGNVERIRPSCHRPSCPCPSAGNQREVAQKVSSGPSCLCPGVALIAEVLVDAIN